MPEHKCILSDGNTEITIRPDGRHELDPCLYQEIETYENVTVHILRCVRCGHIEVEWERQAEEEKRDSKGISHAGEETKNYVEEKRWEEISAEMNYNCDYIRRLHGRALQQFGNQFLQT